MTAIPAALLDTARKLARVRAAAFSHQRAFIDDPSRLKALLCPRRAGKSEADALYLLETAYLRPGSRSRFLALTRQTAKDILWDKLKEINRRLDLGLDDGFNETELSLRVPNGSAIRLMGMDASETQAAKVLGGKYDLAILDEAASFRVDVRKLIKDFIKPATEDNLGTIVMTGTPDPDEARGFFYEVTTGKEADWSLHGWSTLDNPHMRENWQAALDKIKATDPLYMETDEYRCMYLGQWPRDAGGRVYRFDRERNLIDAADVPRITDRVIGVDLGWNDASAIVSLGWAEHAREVYVTHTEKHTEMLLDDLAKRIHSVAQDGTGAVQYVIDGANKTAVMELRSRLGIPFIAADKHEKNSWIRMMNTDYVRARIRVVQGACSDLVSEYTGADEQGIAIKDAKALVWDKRARAQRPPRLVEDPRCENHAADAALYAWRFSRNYLEEPVEEHKPQTAEDKVREFMRRRRELNEARAGNGGYLD
jgi:hypothetical protein